ncbi:MAG TPA: VWA domain-containing protein [Thermoanaerobaculia bacterium]|jgi:VWFA-related protein|nr:VWA domain-containing protein [Thermoanaerobaculia bacterium]
MSPSTGSLSAARRCLLVVVALATFCAAAAGPAAAKGAGARDPELSAEVRVTLVRLPVEVSSSRGEPTRGLGAGDFAVTAGGKPLPIVAVEEVDLDGAAAVAEPTSSTAAPALPPAAARRHVLMLFDFAFTRPERLVTAIASARSSLATALAPSDLVGVAVYLPRGELTVLLNFTADRAAAGEALDTLGALVRGEKVAATVGTADPLHVSGLSARALLAQRFQTRERNTPREAASDINFSMSAQLGNFKEGFLQFNVLTHSAQLIAGDVEQRRRDHAMAMADTMSSLAEALRGVEGRKFLLLFSEGFTLNVAVPAGPGTSTDAGSSLVGYLERALEGMRRAGWVVDVVDLFGLHGGGFAMDGTFMLADKTGGVVIENGGDVARNVGAALEKHAHSYVVTVQVDVPYDGAYHPLEVRVPGSPHADVKQRGGYYAPVPFRSQNEAERLADTALLLAGNEESNDLGVEWAAVPLGGGEGGQRVGLVVEVPTERWREGTADKTALEVLAYAFDAQGASRGYFSRVLELDPAQAKSHLGASGLRVLGALQLPPGDYRLRLLVRERGEGRRSLLAAPLRVGEATRSLDFDALFLPGKGDGTLVVEPSEPAFVLQGRTLRPATHTRLLHGGSTDVILVGAGLAAQGGSVGARILGADGSEVKGGSLQMLALAAGESGQPDVVMARLSAGALPAGDYTLVVQRARKGAGGRAGTARRFHVEG